MHRVEVLIVDCDNVGPDGVRDLLERTKYPNHAIHPCVMRLETRNVEWSDAHPLNYVATQNDAYREMFDLPGPDDAAELLVAREALRAADALAEAAIDVAGIGPGVYMATCRLCDARATGPAGVEVDHSDGCPLPAYLHHAARGAR